MLVVVLVIVLLLVTSASDCASLSPTWPDHQVAGKGRSYVGKVKR